jgi:hypothetical protein
MRLINLLKAQLLDLATTICITRLASYPPPRKMDVTFLKTGPTGICRLQQEV